MRKEKAARLLEQQLDWLGAVDQLSWCSSLWSVIQKVNNPHCVLLSFRRDSPALCGACCQETPSFPSPSVWRGGHWLGRCTAGTHSADYMKSSGAFLYWTRPVEQLWMALSWEPVFFPSPLEKLSALAPLENCNSNCYFDPLCLVLAICLWGLWPLNRLLLSLCWWSTVTTCTWHLMLNPIWFAQSIAFSCCKLQCMFSCLYWGKSLLAWPCYLKTFESAWSPFLCMLLCNAMNWLPSCYAYYFYLSWLPYLLFIKNLICVCHRKQQK